MEHLKTYLGKIIQKDIQYLEDELIEEKKNISLLDEIDLNKANYIVNISSYWEREGEVSISSVYKGNLEDSIKIAERTFRNENKINSIQGNYSVKILINNEKYTVPEEYWSKYKTKKD